MKLSPTLISPLLNFVYSLWCKSLRLTIENKAIYDQLAADPSPKVVAVWHDEIFPIMSIGKNQHMVAIVSKSTDGDLVSSLIKYIGFMTARGSSSRGGREALTQVVKMMRQDAYACCIALDGPRGPRHKAKDGAVFLANTIPADIIPVRARMKHAICFNSWDKFQLPLPFSKVCITIGEPYAVSGPLANKDDFRREAEILERKMRLLKASDAWKYGTPNKLLQLIYRCVAQVLQHVSLSVLYCIAKFFAYLSWFFLRSRRKYTVATIKKHLGISFEDAKKLAFKSFQSNFRSFFEIFYVKRQLALLDIDAIQTNNSEILRRFMYETRPIVVVTAHIGSWELMSPYAVKLQQTVNEKTVVVRANSGKALDSVMLELRTAGGIKAIEHRKASAEVTRCLRTNGLAAFLVDHNCNKREATFLPFLGETAAVNTGPALLALRAKAVVYPVFLLRKDNEFFLHYEEPLDTTTITGSIGEKMEAVARYYTECVEKIVREYPEQWFWMHNRWRTKP